MTTTTPHCDYSLMTKWEWFRRAQWGVPEYASLNPLFTQLIKEKAAKSGLYCGITLGRSGLNLCKHLRNSMTMLISLPTAEGAQHGREIARANQLSCSFVSGAHSELSTQIPHPVDVIFSPNWLFEPDWQILKTHFQAALAGLNAGGCLAFPAPKKHHNWQKMLSVYDRWDDEMVMWHYRDGAKFCVCLRSKFFRAENYADIKYSYISIEENQPVIASTIKRIPAYWSWEIVQDLAKQSGFGEITTHDFPPEASDGDFSTLAVLHKKGHASDHQHHEKLYAYADF